MGIQCALLHWYPYLHSQKSNTDGVIVFIAILSIGQNDNKVQDENNLYV